MAVWREDNRAKLANFIDEVTRLLHNFLARAKSLVDHTRVFTDDMYEDHGFKTASGAPAPLGWWFTSTRSRSAVHASAVRDLLRAGAP